MKHPVTGMPMDPAVNGYIGAGYFADQHPNQQQYNIQQYNNAQQYGQQHYNGAQYNTPQYNQVRFFWFTLCALVYTFFIVILFLTTQIRICT